DQQTACQVVVEYLKDQGSPLANPVYLTVEDCPEKAAWLRPQQLRSKLLRQAEVTPAEVLSLRAWFPKLAEVLNVEHEELRNVPANVMATPTRPAPTTDMMVVSAVTEPYRQTVR